MTVLLTGREAAPPCGDSRPRPVLRHPRAVAHRQPTPAHAHPDREEPTVPHVLVHQRITDPGTRSVLDLVESDHA